MADSSDGPVTFIVPVGFFIFTTRSFLFLCLDDGGYAAARRPHDPITFGPRLEM